MNWVIYIWSLTAGICLTLGGIHLVLWARSRDSWANLLFAIGALAASGYATHDMFQMTVATPAQYAELARWTLVLGTVVALALVGFIRLYLQAGRLWLLWLICALRALILGLNFTSEPNFYFAEVTGLQPLSLLGQTIVRPVGVPHSWAFLQQLSHLLIIVFALDAARTAAKGSRGKAAWLIGGATAAAVALAMLFTVLRAWGILPSAFVGQLMLLPIIIMAYQLSLDMLRAGRLAKALRDAEARMRLAARAADLGFWDWDLKREEVWIDDIGRERIGVLGPELSSHEHYLSLVHPDDRERVRQSLDRAIENSGDFRAEFRMTDPSGAEHWVAASGQVERDPQGEPLRLRGISMDVTARKQFEGEVQRHRDALTHAQRVSAMGQLSSALAHELSQPLGAILRNAEAGELFLRQDPPDLSELPAIFVDIQQDDRRAAEVIDRMRGLLRHRELQIEAIVLRELIEQIVALIDLEVQARHVTLRTTVPTKLPPVLGDRVHIQQVLVNLLFNSLEALDARRAGPRRIDIGAVLVEGGLVELAVKDTGTGIDPDRMADLFEPFVTTKGEGSGIGLAISRTIVEAHGGRIRAENNPGGGACFRFTLPVAREVAPV